MDCEDAIALLGGIKVTRLHYIKEQYPSAHRRAIPVLYCGRKNTIYFQGHSCGSSDKASTLLMLE